MYCHRMNNESSYHPTQLRSQMGMVEKQLKIVFMLPHTSVTRMISSDFLDRLFIIIIKRENSYYKVIFTLNLLLELRKDSCKRFNY